MQAERLYITYLYHFQRERAFSLSVKQRYEMVYHWVVLLQYPDLVSLHIQMRQICATS